MCSDTCGPNKLKCCRFSVQEIVDCTASGTFTCGSGGDMTRAFYELASKRNSLISIDDEYPYVSGRTRMLGKCRVSLKPNEMMRRVDSGVKGFAKVESQNEDALKRAVFVRPGVSAAVCASSKLFQLYSKGVFDFQGCGKKVNHGILLIGYGEDFGDFQDEGVRAQSKSPYWVIKNSWGKDWGMGGYMLLGRNFGNLCGIATEAVFPVGASELEEASDDVANDD
mmetsp:Transcript_10998/g.15242  ORF Transcript_10998/g.15242 Transcript_10998/m.15242 type:complete len:224 (-) Transcript_10998:43-714(-)